MKNILALLIMIGATTMLVMLAGELSIFIDAASIIFILLFMYSATVISFGSTGLIKSIKGLRYLFANDISPTPATKYLSTILKNQIIYIYAAAFIGLLLGSIAIHANVSETIDFHRTYAVNLIVLLYAALIAEVLLRPLAIKLSYSNELN